MTPPVKPEQGGWWDEFVHNLVAPLDGMGGLGDALGGPRVELSGLPKWLEDGLVGYGNKVAGNVKRDYIDPLKTPEGQMQFLQDQIGFGTLGAVGKAGGHKAAKKVLEKLRAAAVRSDDGRIFEGTAHPFAFADGEDAGAVFSGHPDNEGFIHPTKGYITRRQAKEMGYFGKSEKDISQTVRVADVGDSPMLLEALEKNGGFTFDPHGGELVTSGGVMVGGVPGQKGWKGKHLSPEALEQFRRDNAKLLNRDDTFIGGWKDKDGTIYLDVSERVPRDKAEKLGRERGELAGYDLDSGETLAWDQATRVRDMPDSHFDPEVGSDFGAGLLDYAPGKATANPFPDQTRPLTPKVSVGEPPKPKKPKIVKPPVRPLVTATQGEQGFGLGGFTPEQKPMSYYFGRGTPPEEIQLAHMMSREAFDPRGPFREFLEKGRKYPKSAPWYTSTKDIYRDAADEIGEAAAAERVNALLGGFMPASTARSSPPSNLRRAFMWQHLAREGKINPEMLEQNAIELAEPFGHFAQTTAHQPALAHYLRHGFLNPETNPKPASFGANLTGNQEVGTFDTVMSRILASLEPGTIGRFLTEKPIFNKKTGKITGYDYSPKDWAYEPLERGLADAAHEARGMGLLDDVPPELGPTAPYQSIGWHGATGSAEYGGMDDVWRALRKEAAKVWGVSEAEANRRIWKGGMVPGLPEGVEPLRGLTRFE
jgi:hypothetical protein